MSDDGLWSSDGHTFVRGEHEHVVKRPPRAADFDVENTDPTQNDKVERWECLDCGLTIQAARALGASFSSRDCPPSVHNQSDGSANCEPCDPATLSDDLEDFAHKIAKAGDVSAAEAAGRISQMSDWQVPEEEIRRTLRNSFFEEGEQQ